MYFESQGFALLNVLFTVFTVQVCPASLLRKPSEHFRPSSESQSADVIV